MAILNRIYTAIVCALCAIMATSCYQDFEPDIKSTPVLSMNSLITEGDTVVIELSRTWRWDEGRPDYDFSPKVKDGEVELYVNGSLKETIAYSEWFGTEVDFEQNPPSNLRTGYRSGYVAKGGDEIRLVARNEKYGEATASVTVPHPIVIEDVETTVSNFNHMTYGNMHRYAMDLRLMIWFTDRQSSTDYYKFSLDWTNATGNTVDGERRYASLEILQYDIDYDREPLFTEHLSPLESAVSTTSGYTIFSDRQISGQRYPLHLGIGNVFYDVVNPDGDPSIVSTIDFRLDVISQSYYKHVLSVWQSNDGINGILGSIGLGDPVWEASNVSTGAGVISASAPYIFRLNMTKWVEEAS